MDKLLRPERFDTDPSSSNAAKEWCHWKTTFQNFMSSVKDVEEAQKLQLFTNYISHNVFEYVSEAKTYADAVSILDNIYIKPQNEAFARHILYTRKQQHGENMSQYIQILNQLSKDCNFKNVTAKEHRELAIRDAFISGLLSNEIRQRLLEKSNLTLDDATSQALSLESAQKHSEVYQTASTSFINSSNAENHQVQLQRNTVLSATGKFSTCYYCGNRRHDRSLCPALNATCKRCSKKGNFSTVCRSSNRGTTASISSQTLASVPGSLSKTAVPVAINQISADALIDTGSSETYLNESFVLSNNLPIQPSKGYVSMAQTSLRAQSKGFCIVNLSILDHQYANVKISVLPDLCADIIVGHDIFKQHKMLTVHFGGQKSAMTVLETKHCSLAPAKIDPPKLFANLSSQCKPIATKSRKFSHEDAKFISSKVQKLLSEGIIEESTSSWRAQVLVTKNENHKKRMVVDYSQTINKFTYLDAYPLPNIEGLVRAVSKFDVFSTFDLQSAYHQFPIRDDEKQFTAFEADGNLYQFNRIPFGVTNGVACFQRVLDTIIRQENLEGVFAYLDDITICGKNQEEHDKNLSAFLTAVKKYNLTINESKSSLNKKSIKLLGYLIGNRTLKPDPARLEPLQNLPVPTDKASLQRAVGMFAHYSKWIPRFSEKNHRIVSTRNFPMQEPAITDFHNLKTEVAKSAVTAIEENIPFVVETDASEHSIAAILSQSGRPVAFFSKTLSHSEQNHSAVEKEALAIVEALKKWRHFLIGRHFKLITDQRSVSFMFDTKHSSKIKNEKIQRWRLELSCYSYDIVYRPGNENIVADTFSRVCGATTENKLYELHDALCHPGITRMFQWIRSRNLPYSIDDVRKMNAACTICRELKPTFSKNQGTLIKSTKPFEKLNIDFKGPLPTSSKNRYLLTIVDEFSRFPFAYACPDMTAGTVIKCFINLFSIFGMPSYIHSDRGSSFMSKELKDYFHSKGIATSRTTAYNPEGNGQVERFNGTIWKTISLALRSRGLKTEQWESVLEDALHSIRSLLCVATNQTPHERMFEHSRKSSNGQAIPSWLSSPGPVWMKKNVRKSKYDPFVEEVYLLEANPDYAYVRFPDGREDTVNLRHLAPRGSIPEFDDDDDSENSFQSRNEPEQESNSDKQDAQAPDSQNDDPEENPHLDTSEDEFILVRPRRNRQSPKYLTDYVLK